MTAIFDLREKRACVTGAGGLLGKEFVRTLLDAGAKVAVLDRNEELCAAAIENADAEPEQTISMSCDVTSEKQVAMSVERICDQWGGIDILVNSAALDPKFDKSLAGKNQHTFEEYPVDLWTAALTVNLTGTFLCCREYGRKMKAQGGGTIINVASTYGVVAPDQRLYQRDGEEEQTLFKPAGYPVTKAGVIQLTRYLAVYWADSSIRVNTLTPHGVFNDQDQQFLRRFAERSPMKRMAERTEMNGALLFLASDASSYMTGGNLVVDGGWTAW